MVSKTETTSSRFSVQTSLFASTDDRSGVASASETQSSTTALSRSPEIVVSSSWDYVRISTATVSRTTQDVLLSSAVNGSISQKGTSNIRLNWSIPTTNYPKTPFYPAIISFTLRKMISGIEGPTIASSERFS